jgi:hypothetical protein
MLRGDGGSGDQARGSLKLAIPMKSEWLPLLVACLLSLCVGAGFGGVQLFAGRPPPPNSVVSTQSPVHSEGGQKASDSSKDDNSEIIPLVAAALGTVASILTLIVIIYQTLIFRGQHKIMERQADIAEQAMTISDWPYALVESHFFQNPTNFDAASWPPSATYTIVFRGRTPAVFHTIEDILIFEESLPEISNVRLNTAHPNIIRYDGDIWEDSASMTLEIALPIQRDLFGITACTKNYFLIGRATYDDVFGNQHVLAFCYRGNRHGGRGAVDGGIKYNYHRTDKKK